MFRKSVTATFLVAIFALHGLAQQAPPQPTPSNDFEVIVAGSNTVTITPAPTPAPKPTPVKAAPTPKNVKTTPTPTPKNAVSQASTAATGRLPLRVEVSDNQPTALITLAVGAATRFQTEERPSRLVIGNLTDIGVTKAGTDSWNGFYLRPTSGGIATNMFIEFASGATVMINLQTVSPKQLRPGDYNSEVFVKTATSRQELSQLRIENNRLKDELAKARNDLATAPVPAVVAPDDLMALMLLAGPNIKNNGRFWAGGEVGKLKVSGLSPFWKTSENSAIGYIELSNRDKNPLTISSFSLEGAAGNVATSLPAITIPARGSVRLALRIILSEGNLASSQSMKLRVVTSEGVSKDLALPRSF